MDSRAIFKCSKDIPGCERFALTVSCLNDGLIMFSDSTFESWDESRLREFLLEQGVVEPSGPKESLVLLAKQKYASYTSFASSLSASATSLASEASASATSLASEASVTASSAVYGSPSYQASKSVSSFIAQATGEVARARDDSKDYVYSTWDDNRLR